MLDKSELCAAGSGAAVAACPVLNLYRRNVDSNGGKSDIADVDHHILPSSSDRNCMPGQSVL